MTTETPWPPPSADERSETTAPGTRVGGTFPPAEGPAPETGEAPFVPPKPERKIAAKSKPGKKVPARGAAKGKGKSARAGMKTKRTAGKKPRAAQKKGPKKAAAKKKAAKRRPATRGRR
jgi:hypothetical protein